ncbi:MAG: glycosyltransferase family 2 protein [Candidatus Levyibacteriota bacterium]|nr:MAG: glycosyltransferase family 2 protein [Candidatus Levybacteria bacterium]
MKVIIIIPTYNEKGNIERLIEILQNDVFPNIKNHQMHILVVDDSSPDKTADVVEQLTKKYKNLHLLNNGNKLGLGAAYVRGMNTAIEKLGAEVMFEMDADLSHDPKKVPEFLQKIDEGYDMVIGTRYSQGGSIPSNWGIIRKIYSVFGNLLVKAILMRFWIHDWTGGFRALRKEVFLKEKKELTSFRGYTFQVSFLHKAVRDGFKVAEVPIHFTDRTLGRSKIAPKEYIAELLTYVVAARFWELVYSPFLKYAITGFTGYIINAVGLEYFYRQGFHPSIAGAIGAELSIIWNFVINNFWAFNQYKITNPLKILVKFPQFNLVSFGSLIIISAILAVGNYFFGPASRQIFLVIAIGFFVIPYSYSMYNIFIWKRWHISFLSGLQKMVG